MAHHPRRTLAVLVALGLGTGTSAIAQSQEAQGQASSTAGSASGTVPQPQVPAPPKAPAAPSGSPDGITSRWLDLQAVGVGGRFRYIDTSAGAVSQRQGQYTNSDRARLKFDADAKYTINATLATGNTFTGGWNNSGIGTGAGTGAFFLKQLYASLKPIKGIELQYGGLGILRGESTEITTYDNDGYITGERVSLRRPRDLFLDEVAVTYAYLGDLSTPGIGSRWHRLGQSNYHQFLLAKKVGKLASLAADYTFQSGADTLRQGIRLETKGWSKALDGLRLEVYERVDVKPDQGYAITLEKTLFSRLAVAPGFASIDPNYGGLNADRFNKGKRLFVTANLSLTPELSLQTFYARAVHNAFPVTNRTRLDVILSLNVVKALQRTTLLGQRENRPAGS
jgi:hypothetical protein